MDYYDRKLCMLALDTRCSLRGSVQGSTDYMMRGILHLILMSNALFSYNTVSVIHLSDLFTPENPDEGAENTRMQ